MRRHRQRTCTNVYLPQPPTELMRVFLGRWHGVRVRWLVRRDLTQSGSCSKQLLGILLSRSKQLRTAHVFVALSQKLMHIHSQILCCTVEIGNFCLCRWWKLIESNQKQTHRTRTLFYVTLNRTEPNRTRTFNVGYDSHLCTWCEAHATGIVAVAILCPIPVTPHPLHNFFN